jgi:SET domain-containing protein
MRHIPSLYLLDTNKGRSVFTAEEIHKGDIIEICPVILLDKSDAALIHKTLLHDYYFVWPEGGAALALGYGSLYNHSYEPNARIIFDTISKEIIIECIKTIPSGTEILYDYTGGLKTAEIWFTEL